MDNMDTPRTRAEFERNLNLLQKQIEEGKFHVPSESRTLDSAFKFRFLPNGRIDLLSVDDFARMNANLMANMSDGFFDQIKQYVHSTSQPDSDCDAESPSLNSDDETD